MIIEWNGYIYRVNNVYCIFKISYSKVLECIIIIYYVLILN